MYPHVRQFATNRSPVERHRPWLASIPRLRVVTRVTSGIPLVVTERRSDDASPEAV